MTRRKSIPQRTAARALRLQPPSNARMGYTYFINGNSDDGYRWVLVNRSGASLCSSDVFASKQDCRAALKAVQRHAATSHVIDEKSKST